MNRFHIPKIVDKQYERLSLYFVKFEICYKDVISLELKPEERNDRLRIIFSIYSLMIGLEEGFKLITSLKLRPHYNKMILHFNHLKRIHKFNKLTIGSIDYIYEKYIINNTFDSRLNKQKE